MKKNRPPSTVSKVTDISFLRRSRARDKPLQSGKLQLVIHGFTLTFSGLPSTTNECTGLHSRGDQDKASRAVHFGSLCGLSLLLDCVWSKESAYTWLWVLFPTSYMHALHTCFSFIIKGTRSSRVQISVSATRKCKAFLISSNIFLLHSHAC